MVGMPLVATCKKNIGMGPDLIHKPVDSSESMLIMLSRWASCTHGVW